MDIPLYFLDLPLKFDFFDIEVDYPMINYFYYENADRHWRAYNSQMERWEDMGAEWWAPSPFDNVCLMLLQCPFLIIL